MDVGAEFLERPKGHPIHLSCKIVHRVWGGNSSTRGSSTRSGAASASTATAAASRGSGCAPWRIHDVVFTRPPAAYGFNGFFFFFVAVFGVFGGVFSDVFVVVVVVFCFGRGYRGIPFFFVCAGHDKIEW
jgi:hypothetical protein